jgi:hypothetical protein
MLRDCTILRSDRSDQRAHSEKEAGGGGHLEHEVRLLMDSHESRLLQVSVLLVFVVHQVSSECLHGVVDSVAADVLASLLHEVLRPVLVPVASAGELVMLNHLDSVLQDTSVEEGVERVTRSTQGVNTGTVLATVLLLGKIFYTRDPINDRGNYLP